MLNGKLAATTSPGHMHNVYAMMAVSCDAIKI